MIMRESSSRLFSLPLEAEAVMHISPRRQRQLASAASQLLVLAAALLTLSLAQHAFFQTQIDLTPGVEHLVRVLKRLGYRLAVISGGFIEVVEVIQKRLGLDYAFANSLEVRDGKLTGELVGPIVNRQRKADLLESLAQTERIELDQVIAIGDGANDLDMLDRAGLGIAFNAKRIVQEQADYAINQPELSAILYLLGISESEANAVG